MRRSPIHRIDFPFAWAWLFLVLLVPTWGCQSGGSLAATDPVAQADEPADSPVDKGGPATQRPANARGSQRSEVLQQVNPVADAHPFPRRIEMPEIPPELSWLNTKPLKLADLRGKFVLLDFWTYCCINCMHILPELKKLEHAYANELVVIGVHSAKFTTEKDTENIAEAILRYEIEHPVVNDNEHKYWNLLQIRSWPTLVLIDPEGHAVRVWEGEVEAAQVDEVLKHAIPFYRAQKLLDETPLRFDLLEFQSPDTPLLYPGKVLADEPSGRLFISDSNHNRLVIASFEGELLEIIGSGEMGMQDGSYAEATFNHPQGMALHENVLYVADTENHALRKIDLTEKQVSTIAGVGRQGRNPWPGFDPLTGRSKSNRWVGKPKEIALNSPWDLWVHKEDLYIAMAGPHQIWKMTLDESEIGPYAGNGREDIVDGRLLPLRPYAEGASSFAQPSGLSSDGEWLYVADSEGSSIRAVPFHRSKSVRTVVGTADLPYGRLFEFGDQDGERSKVRLQHCLAVVFHDGNLYVADTYNNKIKVVDARTGKTRTLAGTGESGKADQPAQFHEPAGLSYANGKLYVADTNNHLIRTVDITTGAVETLPIQGLEPPVEAEPTKPDFSDAQFIEVPLTAVQPQDGKIQVQVRLNLPQGWKVNDLAPIQYWLEPASDEGPIDREALTYGSIEQPTAEVSLDLPVTGEGTDQVTFSMIYYYCQIDGSLCKVGSAVVSLPIEVAAGGEPVVTAEINVEQRFP